MYRWFGSIIAGVCALALIAAPMISMNDLYADRGDRGGRGGGRSWHGGGGGHRWHGGGDWHGNRWHGNWHRNYGGYYGLGYRPYYYSSYYNAYPYYYSSYPYYYDSYPYSDYYYGDGSGIYFYVR